MNLSVLFGVLGFFAVARIAELVIAKQFAKRASDTGRDVEREPVFLWMVVLHTTPFVLIPLEVILLDRPFTLQLAVATLGILAVAFALRVWTLSTLGARWNVRIVRPDAIITSGPYAFIRHPNYAVVILELFALPLVHGAYLTCAFLTLGNALILMKRIPAEEKVLFEVPGYREAMGNKARFFPLPTASRKSASGPSEANER